MKSNTISRRAVGCIVIRLIYFPMTFSTKILWLYFRRIQDVLGCYSNEWVNSYWRLCVKEGNIEVLSFVLRDDILGHNKLFVSCHKQKNKK